MIQIYVFVLGLVFASFLDALMYRIEKEVKIKDMLISRSHCDNCNSTLEWFDLIPIFSWIFSVGKCRKCGSKIDIYYPLSELFLGVGFLVLYSYYSINICPYVFLLLLFSLTYYDFHTKSIPQWLTHLTLVIGGVYFILNFSILNLQSIGYFAILALAIFIINKIKMSFGFGDILLFAFFALILSPTSYLSFLFLTLYIAAFVGVILIVRKKEYLKAYIPLVPFMTLAYVLLPILEQKILRLFQILFVGI